MSTRNRTSQLFLPALAALVVLSIVFRGIHFFEQTRALPFLYHPMMDASVYHQWASALASGNPGVAGPYYQSPGYPQILGVLYRIFGTSPLAAVLPQMILGVLTVILTVLLGRRLFGNAEGLLAGLLVLGYGPLYFFEVKVLATTLSVFLSVLVVYLVARMGRGTEGARGESARMVFTGIAAGLLTVVRANLILVPLFLVLTMGWEASRGHRSRRHPFVFLAAVVLVMLPVTVHNLSQGAAVPVATSGGFNFYLGNLRGSDGLYPEAAGVSGNIHRQEAEADSLVRVRLGHSLDPADASRYWFGQGIREIQSDFPGWLALEFRKVRLLLGRDEPTVNGNYGLETDRVLLLKLAAVPFNLLAGLGLVGLGLAAGWFRGRRTARGSLAGVHALLVAVLVSGLFFFMMSRLRIPAVPVLAVLGAHTLVAGARVWGTGARVPVLGVMAAVFLFLALTWRSPVGELRNPHWEAELLVRAGNAGLKEGERERALAAYRLAFEIDPTSLEALRAETQVAMEDGDTAAAIRAMERAVLVSPRDASIRNNLGILYYAAGRPEDCVREMNEATGLDPAAAAPYLYRGLVYRQTRDPRALGELQAALERNPRSAGAVHAALDLLLEAGRFEEARGLADQARRNGVPLDPDLLSRLPASKP